VEPDGETLTFQLVVNDGSVDSVPDEVIINMSNINDPPTCDLARANPTSLWSPNHELVPVGIVGVDDPDDDLLTVIVTEVRQDEPVNDLGNGDTSPDAVIQGDTVLLRSERSGNGNGGRIYQITFTADDNFSGSCEGIVMVCVPHDRRSATCIDDGPVYDSTSP
jgi:hypothetical protein